MWKTAPQGTVGSIYQNSDSFGPEIYHSACENRTVGNFTVKLNYLSGNEPTEATVVILAGTNIFSKKVILPEVQGPKGNRHPDTNVGIIEVNHNGTSFTYGLIEINEELPNFGGCQNLVTI